MSRGIPVAELVGADEGLWHGDERVSRFLAGETDLARVHGGVATQEAMATWSEYLKAPLLYRRFPREQIKNLPF